MSDLAKYELYELEGSVYRAAASKSNIPNPVSEIRRSDGSWEPYEGDGMKPIAFGDRINQENGQRPAA